MYATFTERIPKIWGRALTGTLALLWLSAVKVTAQNDSTLLLEPERLTFKNLKTKDQTLRQIVALSANRTPEAVQELPFTIWVVTADDILRQGLVTLVDVLKTAPGLRVSQPGNAVEGETFLMRGLLGNQYVKILINDAPIKPSVAPGMPLGAQLPIRQAARIEIFYGPAGLFYGNEACAGVVNIILKETERPVFTQADLSFSRYGYSSLDVMFGGKLFRDENVCRFSLYGSSSLREGQNVFDNTALYDPANYLLPGLDSFVYTTHPNFRPSRLDPRLLRHESRLVGGVLSWRGLQLTYNRMNRNDAAMLGASPLAFYYNPADRLKEQLEALSLSIRGQWGRATVSHQLSAVNYRIDNSSSNRIVLDRLSADIYATQAALLPDDAARRSLLSKITQQYTADTRYLTARSLDIRGESRLNLVMRKGLTLDAGAQIAWGGGTPLQRYYPIPVRVFVRPADNLERSVPVVPATFNVFEGHTFVQLAWQGKKLRVWGGTAANFWFHPDYGFKPVLAPRAAAFYQIDSAWALFGHIQTGFRRPNWFALANTYRIGADQAATVSPAPNALLTETNVSTEIGLRRTKGKTKVELLYFRQEAFNLIRPEGLRQIGAETWRNGYANTPGRSMRIWGIQSLVSLNGNAVEINGVRMLNGKKLNASSNIAVLFQYSRGREWLGPNRSALNAVREAPGWMSQVQLTGRIGPVRITGTSTLMRSLTPRSAVWAEALPNPIAPSNRFRTWDWTARYFLGDRLVVYVQALNAANTNFPGLDATGTADDLIFNPQLGRIWRFGVNYNMN